MAKQRHPSRPASPAKDPAPERVSPPVPTQTQGISSRLFGLLKKFPMAMTSPSKEIPSPKQEYSQDEEHSDSEKEDEDDDDGEDDAEDEEEEDQRVSESEEEEEEEDPLGDEQCQAIMENFLLETSTRTHLLRSRIQTHFRPALRRRLDFELSRITPSIANVTALDYHQRDQGVLRSTMEHVARLAIEQKTLSISLKRSMSDQELVWNEIEQTHHRKRKRQLTSNMGSASSSRQPHDPLLPNGSTSQTGRALSRSKPPTSRSNQTSQSRKRSSSSVEPTELNPRLPSTPLSAEGKPARLARRNESLLSVNGSPVLSIGPDDKLGLPNSTSTPTITSKLSELFPSTTSASLHDDYLAANALGSKPSSNNNLHIATQFTFVEKSKWKELENQLKSLQIDHSQRQKLDELLNGCLNFGDG